MNQQTDYTSVALYARVSSDRQDVDLSVTAQLRALRDYAERNGYEDGETRRGQRLAIWRVHSILFDTPCKPGRD